MRRSACLMALLAAGCGSRLTVMLAEEGEPDGGVPPAFDAGPDAGAGGAMERPDAGHDPPMDCDPGMPAVLAHDATSDVAMDTSYVYYSADYDIRRVSKCGGTADTVVAGEYWDNLIADDSFLYFSGDGTVERAPIAGGTSELLYGPVLYQNLWGLANNGTRLFWTDEPTNTDGVLESMPLAGGTATPLAITGAALTAADTTHVYFASAVVGRVPVNGGAVEVLGVVSESVRDIAVDDLDVYWADSADSNQAEIFRVPKAGGATEPIYVASGLPLRLALDATHVYFSDYIEGRVLRIDKQTLAVELVADGLPVADGLAVDDANIYVVSFGLKELRKIAKP